MELLGVNPERYFVTLGNGGGGGDLESASCRDDLGSHSTWSLSRTSLCYPESFPGDMVGLLSGSADGKVAA